MFFCSFVLVLNRTESEKVTDRAKFMAKLKFIYSEKATKFCEIFPLLLTECTAVKSKGKILQNFVAFKLTNYVATSQLYIEIPFNFLFFKYVQVKIELIKFSLTCFFKS